MRKGIGHNGHAEIYANAGAKRLPSARFISQLRLTSSCPPITKTLFPEYEFCSTTSSRPTMSCLYTASTFPMPSTLPPTRTLPTTQKATKHQQFPLCQSSPPSRLVPHQLLRRHPRLKQRHCPSHYTLSHNCIPSHNIDSSHHIRALSPSCINPSHAITSTCSRAPARKSPK